MDKYTVENDYGCTKSDGVSDMTVEKRGGTLTELLDKAHISFVITPLNMRTMTAEPAFLVHYIGRSNQIAMTVLVLPLAGADSWAEEYYYFPGMTGEEAAKLNWYEVFEHVHRVAHETAMSKGHIVERCPHCGKLEGVSIRTYEDIRGRKRCSYCHRLWNESVISY